MTDTVNFSDLAQVRVGDVERPKPYPEGMYLAKISGPMTQHKARSGNVAMRFPCSIIGPDPNDDELAQTLAEQGGLKEKAGFNLDFWMSPDARFRFTDFGKAQGASDDLNLMELAEWLVGEGNKPFLIRNKHRPDEDNPEVVYNNFDSPVAVEE